MRISSIIVHYCIRPVMHGSDQGLHLPLRHPLPYPNWPHLTYAYYVLLLNTHIDGFQSNGKGCFVAHIWCLPRSMMLVCKRLPFCDNFFFFLLTLCIFCDRSNRFQSCLVLLPSSASFSFLLECRRDRRDQNSFLKGGVVLSSTSKFQRVIYTLSSA